MLCTWREILCPVQSGQKLSEIRFDDILRKWLIQISDALRLTGVAIIRTIVVFNRWTFRHVSRCDHCFHCFDSLDWIGGMAIFFGPHWIALLSIGQTPLLAVVWIAGDRRRANNLFGLQSFGRPLQEFTPVWSVRAYHSGQDRICSFAFRASPPHKLEYIRDDLSPVWWQPQQLSEHPFQLQTNAKSKCSRQHSVQTRYVCETGLENSLLQLFLITNPILVLLIPASLDVEFNRSIQCLKPNHRWSINGQSLDNNLLCNIRLPVRGRFEFYMPPQSEWIYTDLLRNTLHQQSLQYDLSEDFQRVWLHGSLHGSYSNTTVAEYRLPFSKLLAGFTDRPVLQSMLCTRYDLSRLQEPQSLNSTTTTTSRTGSRIASSWSHSQTLWLFSGAIVLLLLLLVLTCVCLYRKQRYWIRRWPLGKQLFRPFDNNGFDLGRTPRSWLVSFHFLFTSFIQHEMTVLLLKWNRLTFRTRLKSVSALLVSFCPPGLPRIPHCTHSHTHRRPHLYTSFYAFDGVCRHPLSFSVNHNKMFFVLKNSIARLNNFRKVLSNF